MTPNPAKPRLGDLLIEHQAVLPHQLMDALDRQRGSDRRVCTCLLEAEGIDEGALLDVLARQHALPPADAETLRHAPRAVVTRLRGPIARRLGAVPFAETATGFAVAMRDPGDLAAQDELRFALGRRIVPHAALELRIFEAIDLHYGEAAPEGYRRLWDRLHRRRHLWQGADPMAQPSQ